MHRITSISWQGLVNANAYTVKDSRGTWAAEALFPAGALFNHSCVPNLKKDFEEGGRVLVCQAKLKPRSGDCACSPTLQQPIAPGAASRPRCCPGGGDVSQLPRP